MNILTGKLKERIGKRGGIVAFALLLMLILVIAAMSSSAFAADILPLAHFQTGNDGFSSSDGWSRVSSTGDPNSCNPSGTNYFMRTSKTGTLTCGTAFNTKGYYNVALKFDSRCTSGGNIRVDINENGTWTAKRNVTGTNWGVRTVDLNATVPNTGLRFVGVGTSYARVDCVTITGDLDTTPPNAFTPTANPTGWTTGNVSVSFSTTDAHTYLDGYEVAIDSGAYTATTSPYTMTQEGQHIVNIRAKDAAGNTRVGSITTYIDRTAPSQPGTPSGTPACGSVTFTWTAATDSGSGIADYFYQIDDDPGFGSVNQQGWTGGPNNRSATINSAGTWYCRVLAKDGVGQSGSYSATSDAVATLPDTTAPTSASNDGPICEGGSATLSYTGGSGTTLKWYTNSCGGTYVGSGQDLSVSPSETTTYYARWENDCGESDCVSTTVTVNVLPDTPTNAQAVPGAICSGSSSSLSASVGEGEEVEWFADSCGGTLVTSQVSPTSTTTYYARAKNTATGCISSSCADVTVTVVEAPTAPTSASANPAAITAGLSSTLSYVGGSGSELTWYSESCGGTYVGSGQDLSVSPTETTTYYCRWESTPCDPSECASVTVTVGEPQSVGEIKQKADSETAILIGKTVTAVFADHFYVQDDSSSGIRVAPVEMPEGLAVGDSVNVTGTMQTTSDFERVIGSASVTKTTGTALAPVNLTNKDLGGGDFFYDAGTGAGQIGVEDGVGTNNIGLLVKTCGTVTSVGDDHFYIDDGTNARDFSVFNGIRVRCGALTKPTSGDFVCLSGISSILKVNGRVFRSVTPRDGDDIQTVIP